MALRFNDKDAVYLSKNTRLRTERAGVLLKRGETNTAFKQRYFVLKANLLFYFKAANDAVPIGFVLLEDCRVSAVDGNDCQIVIAFSTPGSRSYLLEAKDRDEANQWIQALQGASWFRLRQTVSHLQEEVERLRLKLPVTSTGASALGVPESGGGRPLSQASPALPAADLNAASPTTPLAADVAASPTAVAAVLADRPRPANAAVRADNAAPPDTDDDDDDDAAASLHSARPGAAAALDTATLTAPANMRTGRGAAVSAAAVLADVPLPPMHLQRYGISPDARGSDDDVNLRAPTNVDVSVAVALARNAEAREVPDAVWELQVVVSRPRKDGTWQVLAQTEVADGRIRQAKVVAAEFLVSLPLPADVSQPRFYRLSVFRTASDDADKMRLVGEAVVASTQLLQGVGNTVTLPLTVHDTADFSVGGTSTLQLAPLPAPVGELVLPIAYFSVCPITGLTFDEQRQQYRLPSTSGQWLQVVEVLYESRYAFIVPLKFIEFLVDDQKAWFRELQRVDEDAATAGRKLPPNLETLRQQQENSHLGLLTSLKQAEGHLTFYSARSFRPSVAKKPEDLQFIAINCHVHDVVVLEAGKPDRTTYGFVTVGAAAAHRQGFKRGGLKTLLEAYAVSAAKSGPAGASVGDDGSAESPKSTSASSLSLMMRSMFGKREVGSTTLGSSSSKEGLATVPTLGPRPTSFDLSESPPPPASLHARFERSARALRRKLDACKADMVAAIAALRTALELPTVAELATAVEPAERRLRTVVDSLLALPTLLEPHVELTDRRQVDEIQAARITLHDVVQAVVGGAAANGAGPSAVAVEQAKSELLLLQKHVNMYIFVLAPLVDIQMVREDAQASIPESLRMRLFQAQSHTLTALVTLLVHELELHGANELFQRQLDAVGFLIHFESLLSTIGDERGMLEDYYAGIRELSTVRVRLTEAAAPHELGEAGHGHVDLCQTVRFEGTLDRMVVVVSVPSPTFATLIPRLRDGALIAVYPVFFSQGVNEQQTYANAIGESSVQDLFNWESLLLLRAYSAQYRTFLATELPSKSVTMRIDQAEAAINSLAASIVGSRRNKNTDVLTLGERAARLLNGGRVTSCKSAKDRTSMAVTVEAANLLQTNHLLPEAMVPQVRDVLRSEGVRLVNAMKNTGKPRFAFNKLQMMTLPKAYRPPKGTGGGNVS